MTSEPRTVPIDYRIFPLLFPSGAYIFPPRSSVFFLSLVLFHMETLNPCLTCGACCAFFRASFYWAESDLATPGGVPHILTDHLQTHFLVMKGTGSSSPRCVALRGVIGESVSCAIYERRASPCRDFIPSFQNGEANERCDRARARWGLPPLDSDSWSRPLPGNFPKAA